MDGIIDGFGVTLSGCREPQTNAAVLENRVTATDQVSVFVFRARANAENVFSFWLGETRIELFVTVIGKWPPITINLVDVWPHRGSAKQQ